MKAFVTSKVLSAFIRSNWNLKLYQFGKTASAFNPAARGAVKKATGKLAAFNSFATLIIFLSGALVASYSARAFAEMRGEITKSLCEKVALVRNNVFNPSVPINDDVITHFR